MVDNFKSKKANSLVVTGSRVCRLLVVDRCRGVGGRVDFSDVITTL